MGDKFHLRILTPSADLLSAQVKSVILPTFDGQIGVLPGHENRIGALGSGLLVLITEESKEVVFAVSSGLFEVRDGELTVTAQKGVERSAVTDVNDLKNKLLGLEATIFDANTNAEKSLRLTQDADFLKAQIELGGRPS